MVKQAENVDVRRIEVEENIITDVQYLLQDVMNEKGLSRADVARLAGLSKARVTQLLRDDANPTVRTLAAIFSTLGEEISVVKKLKASKVKVEQPEFSWTDFAFPDDEKGREISHLAEMDLDKVLSASIVSALKSRKAYSGKEQNLAANDNPALEDLLEFA